ncbi:hypothetical protein HELRODRAFT_178665 [Helobdella robusta]|uniref:Uncharacterized protein n=1 Tax=Helobdella robusta TaxID=6412 RepID=T1FDJ0_HELRO|nr:hypothetical protein HELRODRAFT_178665 [Helobdella robusta]ESN96865.1 hypothetical protein HELRODRAFT_178665 [Helobdella robusta]
MVLIMVVGNKNSDNSNLTLLLLALDFFSASHNVDHTILFRLLDIFFNVTDSCVSWFFLIVLIKGRQTFVNACDVSRRGPKYLCSGSDDGTVRIWDSRRKTSILTFQNTFQVTSVCFSDTSEQVISGGIDNDLKVWDLRKNDVVYSMKGHMDTGNQHTFEKNLLRVSWSPDGTKIAAGSGDRMVYIWDTTTIRILYKFPGHGRSVNEVDFHPFEPIICSGSSDKQIYLGEIE